ncbi:MAG: metallopeptidase TldD-related protein [Myxococcota bacterium]|nr:metallopeptidase TldD-related protein [Myxococcota bacterium]
MKTVQLVLWSTAAATLARGVQAAPAGLEPGASDPLLESTAAELVRAAGVLGASEEPLYWMAYGVVDRHSYAVEATGGAASAPSARHIRLGDVDLRVGSMALDNTHKIRDAGWFADDPRPIVDLPIEDDPPRATALAWWRATDDTYRAAVRRLIKVRTNDVVKVAREDQSADFSAAEPVVELGPVRPLEVDLDVWQDHVRAASAALLAHPQVHDGNVSFHADDDVHYLATTDGTRLRHQRLRMRVSVWASTTAEDGMSLQVYDYVDATSPDRLPDADGLLAMADGVAERLTALRSAPLVEPYVGPAILRGRAAAVFFHEILGHRVEGHRQKDEDEGQTLTDKVGEQIFPAFLSVHDDPTIAEMDGVELNGHYAYDDEGVPGQRVPVVEDGVLRSFLLSRSPIEGFPESNGHGRRQAGSAPVARQGNLLVSASEVVPYETLRRRLIAEIQAQGRPFGLIFDDITGGFTFTGRTTPNSYAVQPVTVWKVYPDGRPDELVRGVDLIGTPLLTFGRITAASDSMQVFNGMCGAESGWVPVSAASPDLLVSEVEVQRGQKANDRPPLLPPPGFAAENAEARR